MNGVNPSQALQTTWREHRVWSKTADEIKQGIECWQLVALVLAVLGAIIETAAAQLAVAVPSLARTFSLIGAGVLASVPFIRSKKLGKDRVRDWIRARSASEGLKTEVYFYLTQTPPYAGADLDGQLAARRDEITGKVKDLVTDAASDGKALPGPLDVNSYIKERVNQQIEEYYDRQAQKNARLLKQIRTWEFVLGSAAAILGALGAVKGMEQSGAWVAVLTTLAGAVTAHVAAARYEFLMISYRATARRLESLRDKWPGSKMPAAEFIRQCEEAISSENQEWMADWLEEKKTPP